jgi:hypothetical protein
MIRKTIARILAAIWTLCIVLGTVIRGHHAGKALKTTGSAHISTHLAVFGVLGLLMILSFDTPKIRMVAVTAAVALGVASELYEHLAFGDRMEYGDVLINTLGVLGGAALLLASRSATQGRLVIGE